MSNKYIVRELPDWVEYLDPVHTPILYQVGKGAKFGPAIIGYELGEDEERAKAAERRLRDIYGQQDDIEAQIEELEERLYELRSAEDRERTIIRRYGPRPVYDPDWSVDSIEWGPSQNPDHEGERGIMNHAPQDDEETTEGR